MRILVTNDDGLASEGLQVLAALMRRKHDVWVVAPSTNCSGAGHGISMTDPLQYKSFGEREFSCSGLPVDCSIAGSFGIMKERPDVVLSGINLGANLGTDIVYSGTAAAARQAVFSGLPGIAVSLVVEEEPYYWEPLANFVSNNLEALISLCSPECFVNINAPSLASYKGVRITGVSTRSYRDNLIMRDGPDGNKYSFFRGGIIETNGDDNSDSIAVANGYVSVSCIYAQPMSAAAADIKTPRFTV
ncbi:MAG TPA: 5'/3'-nucleotidase SurE [Treponema sp.]|nr:5'/3'-nucleotidase SurE [Treponema sp.]